MKERDDNGERQRMVRHCLRLVALLRSARASDDAEIGGLVRTMLEDIRRKKKRPRKVAKTSFAAQQQEQWRKRGR
jgi:hypothetical protein